MQSASPLPTIDGKYQLLRQLGQGGMGAVYEARHLGTGRRVAVKVIASDSLSNSEEVVSRFQREAMASGAIESQYIAHVTDTGVDPRSGSPYMVMELLVGEDLDQALTRVGPLSPDLALRVLAQACLGMQRAHEAAVVHRDIKPANLFLTRRDRDAGELVVKILDFGIAKMKSEQPQASSALTRTGSMLGSPLYMSPEQAVGKKTVDHRTDIWSLGVVFYQALTGRAPHADADTVGQLIVNICHEPPRHVQELSPWVSPGVAAIVHRALALDPAARFQSAKEMFAAIQEQLPSGYALDASMVVPIPPELRATRQSRFSVPAVLVAARSSQGGAGTDAPRTAPGSTTSGVAAAKSTREPPRARTGVPVVIAMGVGTAVALALLGIGAYVVTSRDGAKAAASSAPETPVIVTTPPPSAPALAPAPPSTGASSAASAAPAPSAAPTEAAPVASAPQQAHAPAPGAAKAAQPHAPAPAKPPAAPTKPAPVNNDIF